MADGPSNFRSWQDEMDLNGEQEQAMLDRALAEARGTRQQAGRVLDDAGDAAQQAQLRESRQGQGGGGVATTTIDRTGGYNDYLKLKLKAENQYRAAFRVGGVNGMVRRQRAQQAGVNEAWTQQGDQQEAAQARALQDSAAGAAGYTRLGAEEKSRDDAKAAAAKEQADAVNASKAKWGTDLQTRIASLWNKADDAGAWTERDKWELGDLGRQARMNGTWDAANRAGAWDAEAKYNAPDSDVGFSPETTFVWEKPTDRAFGAPAGMRGKRRGGFRGWGK